MMRQRLVDRRTGEVIATAYQLDWWPEECNRCGEVRYLTHSIGYYCGFTHDEIGSVTTEYNDGGIVGGMLVCEECHDDWYGIAAKRAERNE